MDKRKEIIHEVVELLKSAGERELGIALAFIRSLTKK